MAQKESCFLLVLIVGAACRGTAAQDCPLNLTGSAFQEERGQFSIGSVLYLYTTPLGSQCSGSISEVEFCYRPAPMAATDRIFTVVTLKPMGSTFRVVTRSNVCAAQADSCTVDPIVATLQRCCATRRLEPVVEVTQDSFYGIETPLANINNTLLFFADISRPGRTLSLSGVSFDVNATLPPDQPSSDAPVAMVRFIVNAPSPTPSAVAPSPTPSAVAPSPTPPAVAPSPTPPAVTDDPTPPITDPPVVDPVEGSVVPSMADGSSTPPNPSPSATPPSGGGVGTMAVTGIVIGLLVVIIIVLVVLAILFVLRCKKQKTIVQEQPQEAVLESNEAFVMIRNDAYTAVIATERNEAYVTNADVIPAARNEAYGAVATELEGGNSLNRDDTNDAVYTELQDQTADDQGIEEYSYAYVR